MPGWISLGLRLVWTRSPLAWMDPAGVAPGLARSPLAWIESNVV